MDQYTHHFTSFWPDRLEEFKPQHLKYMYQWYHFKGFPDVIKDIIDGKSFIRCNFPLGGQIDIQEVLNAMRGKHFKANRNMWFDLFQPAVVQTYPPLPSWCDLQLEELLPEEESH